MILEEMAADVADALAEGTNMTLIWREGQKTPPKFTRGELLCENFDGSSCYKTTIRLKCWHGWAQMGLGWF